MTKISLCVEKQSQPHQPTKNWLNANEAFRKANPESWARATMETSDAQNTSAPGQGFFPSADFAVK